MKTPKYNVQDIIDFEYCGHAYRGKIYRVKIGWFGGYKYYTKFENGRGYYYVSWISEHKILCSIKT